MKRSEMIKKMCILIESFDNPYIEEAMEAILNMQQENGMLPPAYYDSYFDDEPEWDGMINEWEKEDDER